MRALPNEIWARVISFLQRPHPLPGIAKDRSEMRQPELAVCMRVSILFNDLAGPLLYRRIYTDNPLSLSVRRNAIFDPVHPSIRPKVDLLAFARHIDFEYPVWIPPDNAVESNGDSHADEQLRQISTSHSRDASRDKFVDELSESMSNFIEMGPGFRDGKWRAAFERRPTLSLCALFGTMNSAWDAYEEPFENKAYRVEGLDRFIAELSLNHICQRSNNGPLSIRGEFGVFVRVVVGPWNFTAHNAKRLITPIASRGSNTWIIPSSTDTDMDRFDFELDNNRSDIFDDDPESLAARDVLYALHMYKHDTLYSWNPVDEEEVYEYNKDDDDNTYQAPKSELTIYIDAERLPYHCISRALGVAYETVIPPQTLSLKNQIASVAVFNQDMDEDIEEWNDGHVWGEDEEAKATVFTWKHRSEAPVCPACGAKEDYTANRYIPPAPETDDDGDDEDRAGGDDHGDDSDDDGAEDGKHHSGNGDGHDEEDDDGQDDES